MQQNLFSLNAKPSLSEMYNPETRDFKRRLERLSSLARIVEEKLEAQLQTLDSNVSMVAATLEGEARDDYIEWHAEDFFTIGDELPTLLRYSILVGAEAALETYISKTCDSYATQAAAKVRYTDLKGAGTDRMRDYLKKVAGMVFPDGGQEWITMKNLRAIRNAFVHADGALSTDSRAIRVWSQGFTGLTISVRGSVTLDVSFAQNVVSAYLRFANTFDEASRCIPLVPLFPINEEEEAGKVS